jgi:hypothetical protein
MAGFSYSIGWMILSGKRLVPALLMLAMPTAVISDFLTGEDLVFDNTF